MYAAFETLQHVILFTEKKENQILPKVQQLSLEYTSWNLQLKCF